MRREALLAAAMLFVAGCTRGHSSSSSTASSSTAPTSSLTAPGSTASAPSVVVTIGPGLSPAVAARLEALVRSASTRPVQLLPAASAAGTLAPGSLVLAFGETAATRGLISAAEVAALSTEAFVLRSRTASGVTVLATDGPGVRFGSYALLEELGFAFLHPLAPLVPAALALPASPLDRTEEPRWPQRGIHIHTMHPLELTELLNGWGVGDPNDAASWSSMLPEWDRFCEWAVANRLNRVEWFLLAAESWRPFAASQTRQARLAEIVARAHAWGLVAGADVPIAEKQQHAWLMIQTSGTLAQELAQIDARVTWLAQAGFDFIATEVGTSEFTPTDDQKMVAWLDELASAGAAANLRTYVKAHCSTGQVAQHFPDPLSGGPLNYNFLARVCDPRLGVYPHSVQVYGLDDPAPTYGNTDFAYMRTFLEEEAGRREVVWHPETAYWVSYDVDVPLFLPVYGERRLHDLRLIATDENAGRVGRGVHAGSRIQGQMTFSSGWEWGYWLNDVLAARASWDPYLGEPTDDAALGRLLDTVVRPFGAAAADVKAALVAVCHSEKDLLIDGRLNGVLPTDVRRRNGMGYLEGWETWDDLAVSLKGIVPLAETQPEKLGLVEMRTASITGAGPDYTTEVSPLLAAMEARFASHAATLDALRARVPASARPLLDDMADAAAMTALRAQQVHGLYDYVSTGARPRLQTARDALDAAQKVVKGREAQYRVPADRIGGWRKNPTSYAYTYLWSVRSLHYWWRDEEKAVDAPWSPFIMNTVNPADVAIGEGWWIPFLQAARAWGDKKGLGSLVDGLAEPLQEPVYPAGGLRQRP